MGHSGAASTQLAGWGGRALNQVSPRAEAALGERRWRFGIRAKLLVAVGTVAAMTLLAGILA